MIKDRSWVEIDLAGFRSNLRELKRFLKPGQGFMQIVKADAYGHGAAEISRIALEEGAVALGVANVEEGRLLRIQGCKAPILILSPSFENEMDAILSHDLVPTISDPDFARALNERAGKARKQQKVQLKLDSGMHRSGAEGRGFAELLELVRSLEHLEVEGVFSHYAASESDTAYSRKQQRRFTDVIKKHGLATRYLHIANSAALVNGLGDRYNLCRLGILSYGIYTHPDQAKKVDLKPVMTFKSTLAQIKRLDKGEALGYNLTWQAQRKTRYAIVPIGYADGYDFLLSNRGVVMIRGALCNVIGRVSMDMICVDITDLKQAEAGDEVILLGGSDDALRVENLVKLYAGSAYELLCQVGRRAKRYYLDNGKLLHSSPLSRRDFVSSDFPDSKLNQIIQSALAQRLGDDEIGELISREILRSFFYNKDRDIHYRRKFDHRICLKDSGDPVYYRAETKLCFEKVLQNNYFIVACANSDKALTSYFKRKDVEYRWLMDDNFDLDSDGFELTSVAINNIELNTQMHYRNSCLEIRCSHPKLDSLVGKEVRFMINTVTLYPKSSHQLSIFITELTHGIRIAVQFPPSITSIETVPVFSGQNKYPRIKQSGGMIEVSTGPDQWVFPISGVVFAY